MPTPLDALSDALSALPGIGRRTAERLATHLARHPDTHAAVLLEALSAARRTLVPCTSCGAVTTRDQNPCPFCTDPRRDPSALCVVANPADIRSIERSGEFRGRYFALMGLISPMRGEGLPELRLDALLARAAPPVREVLLALDSDVESDATAAYLRHALLARHPSLTVTRLAFGLPAGSAISFSDPVTLARAIRGRTPAP
ncbi:MAG: recombination protein RecR [Kiritimatiellae bacterium]|nr:recombination protein RecR [Kiritimatiellia bacterium]